MPLLDASAIFLAGLGAGMINTIVGSGTLITFPTLLFFGYPPVAANMSNSLGLVAGGISGVHGYRHELVGAGPTVRRLVPMSLVGGIAGALLLLVLPAAAFETIVPVLILLGIVLVVLGPRLQRAAFARHSETGGAAWHVPVMMAGVLLAGVYGGYFGAAQGVLLMGILSALSTEALQRLNGYKNILGTVVNAVAALVFVLVARDEIVWSVAGLIALGALLGGRLGATVGRRLPPVVLRAVIVVIGGVAVVNMVL